MKHDKRKKRINFWTAFGGDRNPIYDGKLSIIEQCSWRKKPDGGFIIISHDEKPFTKYYDVTPQAIALIEYTKDF